MTSTRCAACKYLRSRCSSDCIFSPYFSPNNPERFVCVHRIYGASNIGKMLQQLPVDQRAEAANSLYYEAQCRIKDPVYGCVGIISVLHQQINNVQSKVAKAQAEIVVLNAHTKTQLEHPHQYDQVQTHDDYDDDQATATPTFNTFFLEQDGAGQSHSEEPVAPWFH